MSFAQQLVGSKVICSCFPRVAHVAYDKQLLHARKEYEAMLVSYMYNISNFDSVYTTTGYLTADIRAT
jgi:hypothetical protein